MNTKSLTIIASMLLAFSGLVSCSRARNDAAIIADVQVKIHQDAALSAAPITVQSGSGVVVLSGNVTTNAERRAAESAAWKVKGVKGVINNLQVVTAAAAPPPVPGVAGVLTPEPGAPPATRAKRTNPVPSPAPSRRLDPSPLPAQAAAPSSAQSAPITRAEPSPLTVQAVAPSPAQPAPVQITIPEGTPLTVRLIDPVDTEKNQEGDTFRASLDSPIMVQNKTAIPRNANVTARLVSAKSAGRFAGSSSVVLVLTSITVGGRVYGVQTGEFTKQTASRGKRSAAVIGGTAAAGALIGAIAGGGKGAAIGAAAGAGAGTGVQALTKGQQVKLPAETLLEFQLAAPLTVTPVAETSQREPIG